MANEVAYEIRQLGRRMEFTAYMLACLWFCVHTNWIAAVVCIFSGLAVIHFSNKDEIRQIQIGEDTHAKRS